MWKLMFLSLFLGLVVFLIGTRAEQPKEPTLKVAMLNPVIHYGSYINVTCNITSVHSNCHKTRQWLIGDLPALICENGRCSNNKYTDQQTAICSYNLKVTNTTADDLTSLYTFQYDFVRSRVQPLQQYDVIVLPSKDNMKVETTDHDFESSMNLYIVMRNFFPEPHCTIDMNDTNHDGPKLHVFAVEKDSNSLYKADLRWSNFWSPLPYYDLQISCKLRGRLFKFPLGKHVPVQTVVGKKMIRVTSLKKPSKVLKYILALTGITSTIIYALFCFWRGRQSPYKIL